ncbi:MAG: NYN domain-containing protein [bacterium]|nr:NYN domain-containing protein [bacterium]
MTILFVDSENFKKKIVEFLYAKGIKQPLWNTYDFCGLINNALAGASVDRKVFYAARLSVHPETKEKSESLIEDQRLLKKNLEDGGIEFIYAGRVTALKTADMKKPLFKEKGVDVRMALDMAEMAYEGHLKTAIIGSSDSDLQPAVRLLKRRGVECVYLGFEHNPNKGLMYTTKNLILIKREDILRFLPSETSKLI